MRQKILDLAQQLISVPSTKDNNQALRDVLEIATQELTDFTIEKFEKDTIPSVLVYKEKIRPEKFKIILNAHLDVVPAEKEQFKPYIHEDKLYGRGAYDMKAAAAAMILTFKNIAPSLEYPLGLQLVTDEEIGGFNGTKHQVNSGIKANFVIAGEMTDFNIKNQAKGILWIKLHTKGTSAHGAYPWLGQNALISMQTLLDKIFMLYPTPHKEEWATTVNLAKIETENNTFNKVPDTCTAWLDVRYIPENKDTILDSIQNLLDNNSSFTIQVLEPSFYTNSNHPFITTLQTSIKSIYHNKGQVLHAHGASDLRHFSPIAAAGIEFGPIGNGMHTNNEWVTIQSLEDYFYTLQKFLISL